MATPYTRGDSLGIYRSISDAGAFGLGGSKSGIETGAGFLTTTPIPQLVILAVSGANDVGQGLLSVSGTNQLKWKAPGGTAGTAVTIAPYETKLIEDGTDAYKWIRVYWDGDYSQAALGGDDLINILPIYHEGRIDSVEHEYVGYVLSNHSATATDIENIICGYLEGDPVTTSIAQLPSSGAGTIQGAANAFANWKAAGYARIVTNAPAQREIVYYTSRTDTILTVPSGGRGLFGTTPAAGASTDSVYEHPGFEVAIEVADADGRIQEIANRTTAPTGVTFTSGNPTHALLTSNNNLGLWIHYHTPSVAVGNVGSTFGLVVAFDIGATTYYNGQQTKHNTVQSSLDRYELYAGVDANPTFTTASTTSATLPFTYALSAPVSGTREHRYTVRKRNEYNLVSLNNYWRKTVVNSAGANVTSTLTSPQNTRLVQIGDGKLRLTSAYPYGLDSSPATKWIVYTTTSGVDPDPAVDTATEVADVGAPDLLTGRSYLSIDTSSLAWGQDVRYLVRVKQGSTQSSNLDVVQATIDTASVPGRATRKITNAVADMGMDENLVTNVVNASPAVSVLTTTGQSFLKVVSDIIMRATVFDSESGRVYVNKDLSFVNATISGTSTGPIEVIDANTIYLVVGNTRRAIIDLAANEIRSASFVLNGTVDDIPEPQYAFESGGKTYLSVYNPARNTWQPFLQLDSSGTMTFGFDVIQKET